MLYSIIEFAELESTAYNKSKKENRMPPKPESPLGTGIHFSVNYEVKGYLLDTVQASALIGGVSTMVKKVASVHDKFVATCTIVMGELAFGAYNSRHRTENLNNLNRLSKQIVVLPVEVEVSNIYGMIKHALLERYGPRNKKAREKFSIACDLGISDNDIWIAAVALYYRLIVVTNDDTDFSRIRAVTGLPIERWN